MFRASPEEILTRWSSRLDVATPERVSLALPIAGLGSRSIAYLLDALLILFFWVTAYFLFSLLSSDFVGMFLSLSSLGRTLAVIGAFVTQWLYWTACEVFGRGQTPGKRLLRIRVVSDNGSPVGVLQSAVRNLVRIVDFLPFFYAAGVLVMLLSRENRRLGDLLAGTILVREERIALDKYERPTPQVGFAYSVPAAAEPLSPADVELILSFLSRTGELTGDARNRLSAALVKRYGPFLSDDEYKTVIASGEAAEAFLRIRAQARG
ncbi:MAG TPA: RDD family protein [Myxococcaceae bacterium]|nr:RDD family protein [Myxococcaceae bacterium]